MAEVNALPGSDGGHDIFIESLNGSKPFYFKWKSIFPESLYVKLIVGDIPLPRNSIERMCRRAQAKVFFSMPIGGIMLASLAGERKIRDFIMLVTGFCQTFHQQEKLIGLPARIDRGHFLFQYPGL